MDLTPKIGQKNVRIFLFGLEYDSGSTEYELFPICLWFNKVAKLIVAVNLGKIDSNYWWDLEIKGMSSTFLKHYKSRCYHR